ncbi:MAG TPA: methylenetetrahydrofolate reductase [Stellaceae bacterium]|nr:methylenetetrahydrofolate reductase [Stellaceae bacterium]
MSRLRTLLRNGQFAITAEVTPPLSCDPADLLAKALPLHGLADAVNVTDGASARAHLDALAAAAILAQNGIEPVLQLTGRDRNRIALQSEMVGAAALGIHNLLMLRGDDPKKGDQPDAKPVFDLDSQALVETAVAIRDKGELLHGRKVGGAADFFVGVADAPLDPPPDWQPTSLARKIAVGAQFAQTQFCMDAGVVRRYVARLAEHGLGGRIHLLIGVAPPASARSARWIRDNLPGSVIPDAIIDRLEAAADPKNEGKRICVELLRELAAIEGVGGAHIMAPLNEAAIPEVIEAFRGFVHSGPG